MMITIVESLGVIQKLLVVGFEAKIRISDWIDAPESLCQHFVAHPVWVSCRTLRLNERNTI